MNYRTLIFAIGLFFSIFQPTIGQTFGSVSDDSTLVSLNTAELSRQLDSVFTLKPGRYDPSLLIRCTNQLLSLEKDSLIRVVESAYDRGQSDAEGFGLFLLLRMVFEIPPAMAYPEMHFGKPDIDLPISTLESKHYPLLLVNSVSRGTKHIHDRCRRIH